MPKWIVAMKSAALWRHEILVRWFYPAGDQRDAEMAKHFAFVRLVYGF